MQYDVHNFLNRCTYRKVYIFQYEFLVLSFYFIKFTKILDSIFHPFENYIFFRERYIHHIHYFC